MNDMNDSNDMKEEEEIWLSPAEAGHLVPGGAAALTIRRWAHEGRIEGAFQTPSGRWKIPKSGLEACLNPKGRKR